MKWVRLWSEIVALRIFSMRSLSFRKIGKSESGSTAIEFGILAIPFFMIIFATIETMLAFAGNQLLENAVDTMSRKLRTGQITFNMDRPTTDMSEVEFKADFCNEISIMLSCDQISSGDERLLVDLQTVTNYTSIDTDIPTISNASFSQLDASGFSYNPGGSGTINVLRVYYKWGIILDLIRPYITNVRPEDGSTSYFLMVATTAFKNEGYP